MTTTTNKTPASAVLALSAAIAGISFASTSQAAPDQWSFGVGTGIRSLALDGDIGFATAAGGVVAGIDLDNGDTADMFESAFGLGGFANKGDWTINFGYATLTLEDADSELDAQWDKVQAHLELEYSFATTGNHRWGVVGGAQMTDHDWDIRNKVSGEKASPDEDWTDIVVGLTHSVPFAGNWSWSNRVDYSFGDSEGGYSARTAVNWKPFDHWVFNGGITFQSIEFGDDKDIGKNDFYYYDVEETTIGLGVLYVW